ncbi:MAG: J domain-containing protein [Bacteroidetes bacterium]|nr:J domain-containing protein [Bacteroidota bacterium]
MSHSFLRYPLAWPLGHPRTPRRKIAPSLFRETGRHGAKRPPTFTEGRARVLEELQRYNHRRQRIPWASVQITTNIPLRQDGHPAAGRREPDDQGVVLYFTLDGVAYALPCDRWETLGENLAAIAAQLDAMRGIERWGVGTAKEHFAGFAALPPATEGHVQTWWEVLDLESAPTDAQALTRAYRVAAAKSHPDAGGSHEDFIAVTAAYEAGKRHLQGGTR